ncbi:MAG: hypothetical protein ACRD0K_11290 [Egibacteraceae bacterium]
MTPDLATLREWRAQLTLDPIDPADPAETRYVPIADAGRGAVDDIFSLIELALEPTAQLLSGPSGSGKTTELKRLRGRLEEAGFAVVLADILKLLNQSSEIDIVEFLIALALAFDEGLPAGEPDQGQRWPERFRAFLQRIKVSVGVPGLSLEVDLRKEVKSSQPFVAELRFKLGYYLGDLRDEVAGFCADRVRAHREAHPDSAGVVMIVDSLEKVRGTIGNDALVQASVERLLVHHSDKLRFTSRHMVYTVPPYLMFTDPGLLPYDGSVRPVPIPNVRDRKREEVGDNIGELVQVVERRIPWPALLGSETRLRDVILASGGHLRDLFTILQELIMLVHGRQVPLPAGPEQVQEAVSKVARAFSSITEEDAAFLLRVDEAGGDIKPRAAEVGRLARLLHTHVILAHMNGGTWYEVHPLARRTLGLP